MAAEARLVAVLAVAAGTGRAVTVVRREDVLPQQRDPARPMRRAQPGPPPSPHSCWPTSGPEVGTWPRIPRHGQASCTAPSWRPPSSCAARRVWVVLLRRRSSRHPARCSARLEAQ
uniref:Uncharacterized protein n=1 Tax=Setaria viridis TaxID=4556 RepID=A0A4U6TB45_SETVI|nr:hypothetical protein SEVIR_8G031033v2 [Setaria viridis]